MVINTDHVSFDQHSMELLITKQNQSSPIKKGKYGVSEDIEGFINDFDRVFGFAKKGKVGITQISRLGLRGYI